MAEVTSEQVDKVPALMPAGPVGTPDAVRPQRAAARAALVPRPQDLNTVDGVLARHDDRHDCIERRLELVWPLAAAH